MTSGWTIQNKIVLITGATSGIGKETALELARKGAKVVIHGRNPEKVAATALEIRETTGNTQVDTLTADLSSQSEIHRMADEFLSHYDQLHVLINNAGAIFMKRQLSIDGLEMTFALNHMSYFILTQRLLPLLKSNTPARIINVSSAAHFGATLNFDDLQNMHGYNGWKAYSQSKLANLYFTYELARRLENSGITANALHPGFVATGFGKNNGRLLNTLFAFSQLMAVSPQEGAETSIYLASSPELDGVNGKYFVNKRDAPSSPISYNEQIARRLWSVSEQLCCPLTVDNPTAV